MRIYDNGTYRDMTPKEIAALKEQVEQFIENAKPTIEDEIAELKENLQKLKELFTPLLKLLGGNK